MSDVFAVAVTTLSVFSLAIVSPGPNFVMVTAKALTESRRAGVLTSLGVGIGSGLYAFAGFHGLLLLLSGSGVVAQTLRWGGAGYLAYLAVRMLLAPRATYTKVQGCETPADCTPAMKLILLGLMTNVTNPKAWAFYLSIFTLIVPPNYPLAGKIGLNSIMFLISFGWYAFMAYVITTTRMRPLIAPVMTVIQKLLGIFLLYLAFRIF